MSHGPSLTPAMMRYRYHEVPPARFPPVPAGKRPLLGSVVGDVGSEAFAAWLGHVQAGRIAVR